jgi:uncharacterized membrane protein YeaQ/YmgE (transglycosylase-associated protein family)
MYLLALAVVGLVVGALARLLVPGPDPMSILGTICLGLAGSFVGGLVMGLIFRPDDGEAFAPVGLVGSVLGGIVVLLIYRSMNGTGRRTTRV